MSRPLILLSAFVLFSPLLHAQSVADSPPDALTEFREEAPEALIEASIGDSEVDVYAAGSWTTGIGGTLGAAYHPPLNGERWTVPYSFPDMAPTPFFNSVDLTISVWLRNRYYFETSFLDDFAFNTFLVGLQGGEQEFVQSVMAGNAPLSFGSYPYLSFGSSTTPVPGLAASFRTEITDHEILLRLEPTVREELTFIGTSPVVTTRIEPSAYLRGRFFVLPDGGFANLRIFLEDPEGDLPGFLPSGEPDGRSYREVDPAEAAVFSRTTGTVFLRDGSAGRVLVFYESGGLPVGSAGLGTDAVYAVSPSDGLVDRETLLDFSFDGHAPADGSSYARYTGNADAARRDFTVTVDGVDALLLYEPGVYSPFEVLGRYPALDGGSARLLYRNSGREKTTDASLDVDPMLSVVSVGDPSRSVRHYSNRYPFIEGFPRLYGPGAVSSENYTDFVVAVESIQSGSSFVLGAGVVPGTVSITRNDRPVDTYSLDESSGEIEFPFEVRDTDVIRITYRRYDSDGRTGDLVFGLGNRVRVSDALAAHLALGLRWNVTGGTYSSTPSGSPGEAVVSAGVDYESEALTASIDAGIAATAVDTTGFYRADGMEALGTRITVATETAFPSATPAERLASLPTIPVDDPGARGELYYKDYSRSDAFGNSVSRPYDADDLPAGSVFDYEDGSFVGPYQAGGDDEVDGPVLVLDYGLESTDAWVGADLRVGSLGGDAKERAEVLRFSYRSLEVSEPVTLLLQFGLLGEDLDGDNDLDSGTAGLLPGFEFDDQGIALVTPYRSRTGSPAQTEDADGDGILDRERPSLVETVVIDEGISGSIDWRHTEIAITGPHRALFAAATSLRLLVVREGALGDPATGRVVVGDIEVGAAKTLATSEPGGSGSVQAEETDDQIASLHATFPEVADVFHADLTVPEVLAVSWTGVGAGDSVVVREYVEPVDVGSYGSFAFYVQVADLEGTDAELRLSLGDGIDTSAEAVLPLAADDRWHKVAVNLEEGTIRVDGEEAATVEPLRAPLRVVTLSVPGSPSGSLYIDELHFTDPIPGLGGGVRGSVAYRHDGALLAVGGLDLVHDLSISQRLFVRTPRFSPIGVSEIGPGLLRTATEIEAGVLGASVQADLDISTGAGYTAGVTEHEISVPVASFFTVLDGFSMTLGSAAPRIVHRTGLGVGFDRYVQTELVGEATVTEAAVRQTWSGELTSSPGGALSVDLGAVLNQTGPPAREIPSSYGAGLVSRYQYLRPEDEPRARSGSLDAEATLETVPVGVAVAGVGEYDALVARNQENQASFTVRLPLDVAGIRGELAYGRDWSEKTETAIFGTYSDDIRYFAARLAKAGYLITSPPFYELFRPADGFAALLPTEEVISAIYRPEISVQVSRRIGSAVYNLFLPSALEASYGREIARQLDAERVTQDVEIIATTAAVNLFGRSAGRPLFSFYESEEVSTSALVRLRRGELTGSRSFSATMTGNASFFGADEQVFALRGGGTAVFTDDEAADLSGQSTVAYGFRTPVPSIPVERINAIFSEGFIDHRLSLSGEASGDTGSLESAFGRLGYSATIVVPERGSIAIEAGLGVGSRVEPDLFADRRVLLLGAHAKIEGRLTF